MDRKYIKVKDSTDPVYSELLRITTGDSFDMPSSLFKDDAFEQLQLLREGKMLKEDYDRFLENGTRNVLGESRSTRFEW
jgi:hypothetical protein